MPSSIALKIRTRFIYEKDMITRTTAMAGVG